MSNGKRYEKHRSPHSDNWKRLLSENSPFAVREAFVKLRTNLMFSLCADGEKRCQVFCVTSPDQSEGKSITSANVAISFAMLGKKTLLIDADLRRPAQNKLWQMKTSYGLSDMLARFDGCQVFDVADLPLSIIPVGNIPPNPSELLASSNMNKLVDFFRKQYDYIIIDTPPINTVADAQILSQIVDGTIMVCRSASTRSNELSNAITLAQQSNANVCGVVVTNVNMKSAKSSYRYKYYYGKKYEYVEYYETK